MFHEKWLKSAPTLAERTRRRVTIHLMPFLFFLYVLAFLDRANVSVAALGMKLPSSEGGLGFTETIIGFGSGIFFWGYWILEIPSTISVLHWGARWVFIRILVLWGLSCTLIGAIGTPFASNMFFWLPAVAESPEYQFYFLRFMLGFFEGGFFPSVIVYLSLWYRPEDRAKAIASFMSAIPLSLLLGNPLSGWMLHNINWFGLEGWRWVFILQGVVPVFAGFLALFFLPDRPEKADWLPADEKSWLTEELRKEEAGKVGHGHWEWVHHAGIVLLMTAAYFCLTMVSYGLNFFLPAILKKQTGWSDQNVSILAAVPYLLALIGMLFNGWHSDHTRERIWHVVVPLAGLSLGLFLTGLFDDVPVVPVLIMIFLVGTFIFAHLPAYWPIPTMFLGAVAAASATGFINMVGNLGGSAGPWIVGRLADEVKQRGATEVSFAPGLFTLAPLPLVAAAIILIVGWTRRHTFAAHRKPTPQSVPQGSIMGEARPADAPG